MLYGDDIFIHIYFILFLLSGVLDFAFMFVNLYILSTVFPFSEVFNYCTFFFFFNVVCPEEFLNLC